MERILIGLAFVIAGAMLFFLPYGIIQHSEWSKACTEAGGIPYSAYKSSSICLNPTAIVELK